MPNPSEQAQKKARLLVRDTGFQYAFRMHALLQVLWGDNKAERLRQYEKAGIGKSLCGAERRVRKALESL
jgi:hypothetical protein